MRMIIRIVSERGEKFCDLNDIFSVSPACDRRQLFHGAPAREDVSEEMKMTALPGGNKDFGIFPAIERVVKYFLLVAAACEGSPLRHVVPSCFGRFC